VGLIVGGHARGSLILSRSNGNLTLTLQGPEQNGPASLPGQFSFIITAATGGFRHDVGQGTVVLTLKPATDVANAGTFKMVFKA
jgi:hypothetical protein